MDSSTHKVLCCVGSAIGGQPTQFVMERAIAAEHLDWRVITVEVLPENLPTALAGMKAMGFAAIRFFPPYDSQIGLLNSELSEENQFVGGVTSVLNDGERWHCWHNFGPAFLECCKDVGEWSRATLWINGDSLEMRSLVAACLASSPRKIIWSNAPQQLAACVSNFAELQIASSDNSNETVSQLLQEYLSLEGNSWLVLAGDNSAQHLQALAAAQELSNCDLVVYDPSVINKNRPIPIEWLGKLKVLERSTIEICAEVVDSRLWTGTQPDRTIIEDAYEEYVDF